MTTCLVPRAPDPAITAKARREIGFVPSVLDYVAACPWLAHAEIAFYTARPVHLATRVCELVPYAVARDRGCRHTSGALASFLRFAGYPAGDLRAIEAGPPFRGLAEAPALEHAVAVARGDGRATLARLDGYSPSARAELTALAALVVFGAYVATPLGLPPDGVEAFERSLLAKLVRPLIRRRIHAARKRARPPLDADPGAVFPEVVATLAGSPLHTLARDVLAAAWRADKAAIVATVADGLGAQALVTVDARDAYARASIDVPLAGLTDRAAALALSAPELLDVIGTTALAHALARIAVTLR